MPGAREGFISHVRARAVGSAERLAKIRPKVGRAAPVALAWQEFQDKVATPASPATSRPG